jgi:hypothetical protein
MRRKTKTEQSMQEQTRLFIAQLLLFWQWQDGSVRKSKGNHAVAPVGVLYLCAKTKTCSKMQGQMQVQVASAVGYESKKHGFGDKTQSVSPNRFPDVEDEKQLVSQSIFQWKR